MRMVQLGLSTNSHCFLRSNSSLLRALCSRRALTHPHLLLCRQSYNDGLSGEKRAKATLSRWSCAESLTLPNHRSSFLTRETRSIGDDLSELRRRQRNFAPKDLPALTNSAA